MRIIGIGYKKSKLVDHYLEVSRYTSIDDNRDIKSYNYRYCVNLVRDDIPVLVITARVLVTLMITPHVKTPAPVPV